MVPSLPLKKQLFETFEAFIKEVVSKRRELNKSGQRLPDFLQLLLDAQVEKSDSGNNKIGDIPKQPLTDEELMAQVFVFLTAGYEPTAALLSYLFYSLATNPDCQERLFAEINNYEKEKGEIDYEALNQMPYLDACISETMRSYPALAYLNRFCGQDIKVGEISIKKGVRVHILTYALHHDEKFFPKPFRFIPDRFMPQNKEKLVPYTYLSFGSGPRTCIGMRFAMVQAKLVTVRLLKQFNFTLSKKTRIPLEFDTGIGSVLQAKKIFVKVELRK